MFTIKTIPDQPITNSDRACGRSAMPKTSLPIATRADAEWEAVKASNSNLFASVLIQSEGRTIATYRAGSAI